MLRVNIKMLIVNSEPISHFFPSVSILDFEQVNVSWGCNWIKVGSLFDTLWNVKS